jgi:uncharacterized protein YchJ
VIKAASIKVALIKGASIELSSAPIGVHRGDMSCKRTTISAITTAFQITSKRRKGYPSETQVKRGRRIVHGEKELQEKLGRNDPCPCGSARRFKELLHARRSPRGI